LRIVFFAFVSFALRACPPSLHAALPISEGRQLEVDDVELLIFQDARGISPSDTRSENVTVESMLEDLGAEADARSGDAEPAGVRLVEELREWFAKYPSTEESDETEE